MWSEHYDAVRPEWLDGNGHMNLAYYVVVFDRGTDVWLELAGLGAPYRDAGFSVFAVEAHTIYRHEVRAGAVLYVRSRLVAAHGKRIHLMHEMTSAGTEVALQEVLFIHVDLQTRRPTPLRQHEKCRLAGLAPEAGWIPPAWLGRRVGEPR